MADDTDFQSVDDEVESDDYGTQEEPSGIPAETKDILTRAEANPNLLIGMEASEIEDIKNRVTSGYAMDLESMTDYQNRYKKITELAVMKSEAGDKTFPFQGASRIMMQELSKAAIDFQSRAVPDIVNKRDIMHVLKWGQPDAQKEAKAQRRSSNINYQLKKGIKGWGERQDRALLLSPIYGMYFKKKWWDKKGICESLITADKMIYDHMADSFEEAPRKSHQFTLDHNDYETQVRRGDYEPIEELEDQKEDDKQPKVDKPLTFNETHMTLDLDYDGYCEPYIVTWSKDHDCLVRIEKRFDESDIESEGGVVIEIKGEEFFSQCIFIPDPEKAAIGSGFGTLLFDAMKAYNTMYRQAIDANTLQIIAANSGFISSDMKSAGRSKSGRMELIMGQFTKVDMGAGKSMSDMIWTPQFQGMGQGFYQLITDLRNQIHEFCSAAQSIDVSAGESAALYLGRLQQALKVPNAIMSRQYASLGVEAKRIDDLLKRYLSNEDYLEILDWHPKVPKQVQEEYQKALQLWQQQGQQQNIPPPKNPQEVAMLSVTKDGDFENPMEFITTADPTMGSVEERIARAEMITVRAKELPNIYNVYECEKNFITMIGEANVDTLLPEPSGQPDPQTVLQQAWTEADVRRINADAEKKIAEANKAVTTVQLEQAKLESEIDVNTSTAMKNLSAIDEAQAESKLATLEHARLVLKMALDTEHQDKERGHKKELAKLAGEAVDDAVEEDDPMEKIISKHDDHGDIKLGDILHTAKTHNIHPQAVLDRLHGVS